MRRTICTGLALLTFAFFDSAPALSEQVHGDVLLQAVHEGDLRTIQLLLDGGAEVNKIYESGYTLLMWASMRGNEQAARILLDHGAAINIQDESGFTALIWATSQGHVNVVRLLLARGADKSLRNSRGFQASDFAEAKRRPDLISLLGPRTTMTRAGLPRELPTSAPPKNTEPANRTLGSAPQNGHPTAALQPQLANRAQATIASALNEIRSQYQYYSQLQPIFNEAATLYPYRMMGPQFQISTYLNDTFYLLKYGRSTPGKDDVSKARRLIDRAISLSESVDRMTATNNYFRKVVYALDRVLIDLE